MSTTRQNLIEEIYIQGNNKVAKTITQETFTLLLP